MTHAAEIQAMRDYQREHPGTPDGQARRAVAEQNREQENLNKLFADIAAMKAEIAALKSANAQLEGRVSQIRIAGDGFDGQGDQGIRFRLPPVPPLPPSSTILTSSDGTVIITEIEGGYDLAVNPELYCTVEE